MAPIRCTSCSLCCAPSTRSRSQQCRSSPTAARSLFAASAPSLIATWALGGLYLSLGPSPALSLLKSDSYLAGAGVIVALMGAVAVAATLVRAAFSAVFRSLAPLAPPDQRAGLLASIFIVVYLAFSVPVLIAGVAVTHYGLRDTTYVYGIVVMTLAAMTAAAVWRRSKGFDRRSPARGGDESPSRPRDIEAGSDAQAAREQIAWMRVLIDRANGTPASRGKEGKGDQGHDGDGYARRDIIGGLALPVRAIRLIAEGERR